MNPMTCSARIILRIASAPAVIELMLASQAAHAQASPSSYTTGYRYDGADRPVGVISPDPDGTGPLKFLAVRTTYDHAGRPTKVETGTLTAWQSEAVLPSEWAGFTIHRTVDTTYDLLNRKVTEKVTGSFGVPVASGVPVTLTQYSYDAVGRLECTAVRMNPAVYGALPASACALGTAGGQGPDRITKNVYDAAGQLLQVRKAVGTSVEQAYATYTYTPNGKQEFVIDANGNRAKLEYDGFDRQSKWTFPSKTRPTAFNGATQATALSTAGVLSATDYELYSYDANGNRTQLRKRDGSTITYNYDALNRVTSKVVPERAGLAATHTRDVHYGYDLRGLQTYARFDSPTGEGVSSTYDGFGRVTANTINMDGATRTLRYGYDANGNRTRMAFPDGDLSTNLAKNVTYSYDGLDRPTALLREGTATIASYSYNAAGQRSTFNGGVNTTYNYEPSGRVLSIASTLANSGYNNTWTFGYNPASQITQTVRSNDTYAWTGAFNIDRNYTTNGLNQYSGAGTAAFAYDNNGNLVTDDTNTFTYDVENRLVTRVTSSGTTTLRYDPLGRLYEVAAPTGTTRFLHDGDALVAEYNASGTMLRRYVHGTDGTADDPVAWYEGNSFTSGNERVMRPDWQGSIVLVTDSTGNTIHAINRYDEYGIPQTSNSGRFQYTGQAWLAELGMYYYKARIYSPTLGRFLQTDPIGYDDQINLYAYVANDPVNKTDPTGLECAENRADCEEGAKNTEIADNENNENNAQIVVKGISSRLPSLAKNLTLLNTVQNRSADKPQRKPIHPCQAALGEPGQIEATSADLSFIAAIGLTGSVGRFRNVKTGTTGYFTSYGAGAGLDVGVSGSVARYSSLASFFGFADNLNVSYGLLADAFGAPSGSVSTDLQGNIIGVGGSAGKSIGPRAGASGTMTETRIFSCRLGK